MSEFDWRNFLRRWSEAVLASSHAEEFSADIRASDWLGFEPATEEQIAATEKRLKIPLPPSYRAFLKVSNGWRRTTFAISRVRPVGEVQWFRKENREWIEAYAKPS